MKDILLYALFQVGDRDITVGQLAMAIGLVFLLFSLYRFTLRKFFPQVFTITEIEEDERLKLNKLFRGLALLLFLLCLVLILGLDIVLYQKEEVKISVLTLVRVASFVQVMRLFHWLLSNLFIHNYYVRSEAKKNRESDLIETTESSAKANLKYIFVLIILSYVLRNLSWDLTLYEKTINGEIVKFGVSNILYAILVIFVARLFVWGITQLFLLGIYKTRKVAVGSRYAINQLVKYIVYVLAIIFALGAFGINMSLLLGGAAALLVGIGLGLQQTFNDFISGLVLLFERSVSVGDVLEVDGQVGTVKEIGLRSTRLETRGNVDFLLPNHKLVNEKVINWNHNNDKVRFEINVGVAYGTDTSVVKELLLKSVKDNPYIIDFPSPFVRFQDFGESSLDFTLYFFTRNLMIIEDIKSDIRLEIDRLFREGSIEIPFPQIVVRSMQE
jgi:small-conductance mechanosensitive channel